MDFASKNTRTLGQIGFLTTKGEGWVSIKQINVISLWLLAIENCRHFSSSYTIYIYIYIYIVEHSKTCYDEI